MDPRWQPYLGPTPNALATPEACALLAAGWHADAEECWISSAQGPAMLVSLETWRSLRDRSGLVRARVQIQRL
jgi:hypothetical protein